MSIRNDLGTLNLASFFHCFCSFAFLSKRFNGLKCLIKAFFSNGIKVSYLIIPSVISAVKIIFVFDQKAFFLVHCKHICHTFRVNWYGAVLCLIARQANIAYFLQHFLELIHSRLLLYCFHSSSMASQLNRYYFNVIWPKLTYI